MVDDRMKKDDLDRNMGGAGQQAGQQQKDNVGTQSPGRNPQQDDLSTGQRGAGQEKQGEPRHIKDDFGTSGQKDVGQGRPNR